MANLSNRQPIRMPSFSLGQFSAYEPTMIPQGGVFKLQNFFVDKIGKAVQRGGLFRRGDNPDALVSHWTFDNEDSTDDKGANDGTDTGMAYVDGKFGKCAEFNLSTSVITVGHSATIDVKTIGSFTISAGVYVDTDGGTSVGRIIDKTDNRATPTLGYVLNVQNESSSTVKVRFMVAHDTTDAEIITTTTISTGAWHKIDAVYQADKSLDVYLDGVIATYATDTQGVGDVTDDSAQDLLIGNGVGSDAAFDGKIDDLRIYNTPRTAVNVQLSKIYGLTRFYVPGVLTKVYRVINGTLQALDTDFKSWSDVDTGFTVDKNTNFVMARASDATYRLMIFNGTDNVHSMTTGEVVTDEADTNTDPPKSQIADWAGNRLFVVNSVGDICFSNDGDCQTFARSTNIFNARRPAIAIKAFKENQLVIYESEGMEILNAVGGTPLTEWTLQTLNPNVTTAALRSVVNTGNDQIFLARDGVRILSKTQADDIKAGIISQPIQDVIDSINWDAASGACAGIINGKYFLSIPTGTNTDNDTTIVWDSQAATLSGNLSSGWTVFKSGDWYPSCYTNHDFGDYQESLVMGDGRELALVYQCLTVKTDNGAAIESIIESAEHTIDNATDCVFDPVNIVASSDDDTTLIVSGDVNRTGTVEIAQVSVESGAPSLPIALPFALGGSGVTKSMNRSKVLGRGKSIKLDILHNTYNIQPTIMEYSIFVRPIGVKF